VKEEVVVPFNLRCTDVVSQIMYEQRLLIPFFAAYEISVWQSRKGLWPTPRPKVADDDSLHLRTRNLIQQ
jgi:hypothetical protein